MALTKNHQLDENLKPKLINQMFNSVQSLTFHLQSNEAPNCNTLIVLYSVLPTSILSLALLSPLKEDNSMKCKHF